MAKKKHHGHYCKVCRTYKPNEQFSGKGHKLHICKKCMQLPVGERNRRMKAMDDDEVYEPLAGRGDDGFDMQEMMERMVGDYTNEDLDMMATAMHGIDNFGIDALLNAGFYSYKQPDYSTMCSPIELHLYPLYHAKTIDEVVLMTERLAEVTGKMNPEKREAAVRNLLLNVLADYQHDRTMHGLAVLGALWLAERFDLTGIGVTLLELLRQESEFYTNFIGQHETLLSLAISRLCRDQLPMLLDYVKEDGLIPDGQNIVCDGVIQMAIDHTERRQEVLDWMDDVLEYFLDPDVEITPAIIDHIAYSLTQIRAVELLPALKDAFHVYVVPKIECRGGYRWVKKAMARGGVVRIPFNSIDLFLKMYMVMNDEVEDEEDKWDDNEWDDDDTPWDVPLPDNPFYLTIDRPLKLMTIEVTLNDSPTEIVRTLSIPSNLRLSCLNKVLELAMGVKNGCEQYFFKKLSFYSDADNAVHWGALGHDWTKCAVAEVLFRKGSEMAWFYKQGEVRRHNIRVTMTSSLQERSMDYEVSLIAGTGSIQPQKPFDLKKASQEIDDYMWQSLPF